MALAPPPFGEAASAFVAKGAELLTLAQASVLAEPDAPGDGPLLAVAVAWAQAGRGAFAALAADPALGEMLRVGAMTLAGRFAEAVGAAATGLGGRPAVLETYEALRADATPSGAVPLAALLEAAAGSGPPVAELTSAARDALDALRGDPIALAEDLAAVKLRMATAVDGVSLMTPAQAAASAAARAKAVRDRPRARRVAGYRLVATTAGDTLQAVAARELGDAGRWREIAALNGLAAPWMVDALSGLDEDGEDGTRRVHLAGTPIKVPSPPPRAGSEVADEGDVFGADLDLTGGVLRSASGWGGDFATVSGLPNLRQALRIRLATHDGELAFHPGYGSRLHRLIGGKAGAIENRLAAVYADRALRSDPRIARTEGTRAVVGAGTAAGGDIVNVSTTAVTVDGRHLPVRGDV